MNSLLYISVRSQGVDGEIDAIVTISRSRNEALGVTGALVATPTHFAQMLEGREAALAELMESIGRDPRHTDIRLVHLPSRPRRQLARWSLAYNGDSTYVSELVSTAIEASDFGDFKSFDDIRNLILMFA